MDYESPPQMERNIARSRLVLSIVALLAVYVDPTRSEFFRSVPPEPGWFSIDPYAFGVLVVHLTYSLAIFVAVDRSGMRLSRLVPFTTWVDVLLGALIALFTEGVSSPFYAFFVFGVVEVGLRAGFRQTLVVTTVSVLLYLCLIVVSGLEATNFLIMRPVYLAITGYLVGYLGQQRLNLESRIELMAATQQRHRIARELHDGYAQSLAGINLRIVRCQELLRRGNTLQVAEDLAALQEGVNREFDDVRTYSRSLAGLAPGAPVAEEVADPTVKLHIELAGRAMVIDHVIQILREGLANVCRHARARSAEIHAHGDRAGIAIRVEDDGVGFADRREVPWSIRSRVRDLGGHVEISNGAGGALLSVTLPGN